MRPVLRKPDPTSIGVRAYNPVPWGFTRLSQDGSRDRTAHVRPPGAFVGGLEDNK